jgi:predicted nucleic acid-binding protein
MKQFFVDTSGWLALLNRTDALHTAATKIYRERFAAGWNVVMHDGILLEVGNGFASVRWRASVVSWKERLASSPQITVTPLTANLQEAGWRLYAARPDKDWGIVDCISFVLMREHGLSEALTADRHFEQAGFTKLL